MRCPARSPIDGERKYERVTTVLLVIDVSGGHWRCSAIRTGPNGVLSTSHTDTGQVVATNWSSESDGFGERHHEAEPVFDSDSWREMIRDVGRRALYGSNANPQHVNIAIPVPFGHPERAEAAGLAGEVFDCEAAVLNCTTAALLGLSEDHRLIAGAGAIVIVGTDALSVTTFASTPSIRLLGHGGGMGRRRTQELDTVEDLVVRACELSDLRMSDLSQLWLGGESREVQWLSRGLGHRLGVAASHFSADRVIAGAVRLAQLPGCVSEISAIAVGIETSSQTGPKLRHIIRRNAPLPASATLGMRPSSTNSAVHSVHVYETHSQRMSEARRVMTLQAPAGGDEYRLTLSVDRQGVITGSIE